VAASEHGDGIELQGADAVEDRRRMRGTLVPAEQTLRPQGHTPRVVRADPVGHGDAW
jgi:hypothetical protein